MLTQQHEEGSTGSDEEYLWARILSVTTAISRWLRNRKNRTNRYNTSA